jgi:KipI family sensor histidine kinase inhibitor
MESGGARVLPYGDAAVLVELTGDDAEELTARALGLRAAVLEAGVEGIGECIAGLRSLLIEIDPRRIQPGDAGEAVLALLAIGAARAPAGRHWGLPVCFEGDMAPDLGAVAHAAGMTPHAVIGALCDQALRVALVGHLPGLPYLTGLGPQFDIPRRATPRTSVAAGSVGVAGRMACVYPQTAPGGWHIVGRTPARLVEPGSADPVALRPGDLVAMRAIGGPAFAAVESGAEPGLRLLDTRT